MKKDILRRAFLWVLAVLMLTGIAMPAALAEEEPCTLWLVTEESTSDGMNAAITAEAAQFEEENPGVSIKIDILPNQKNERAEYLETLREKMRAAFRLKNSSLTHLGEDILIESEVEYPCSLEL